MKIRARHGCGTRLALAHFDWSKRPPCVSVADWSILQRFHAGETYAQIAESRDGPCSSQAVAQRARAVLERTHATEHPHHRLACRACQKEAT